MLFRVVILRFNYKRKYVILAGNEVFLQDSVGLIALSIEINFISVVNFT